MNTPYRPCKSYPRTIFVRASDAEKAVLEKQAADAQVSLSRYLVRLAVEGKPPPSGEERNELRQVRYLLEMVSNNLNQMTHRLHLARLGRATPPTSGEIRVLLTAIKAISQELRRRLAR